MSKKDRRKKERGPLTPKQKPEFVPSVPQDDYNAPLQFFGFNTPPKEGAAAFFETETPLCMATEVSQSDVASLAGHGVTALPGEWVVSSGGHDSQGGIVFHGPFKTMEQAFDAASKTYGVTRWTSPIQSF